MKIYSQTNSLGFYIGTQANEGVAGAIDTPSPEFNPATHRARWVDGAWDIRTIEEWDYLINQQHYQPESNTRIAEINSRLLSIDIETMRPLRAIQTGNGTDDDESKLQALENEAQALRIERSELIDDKSEIQTENE